MPHGHKIRIGVVGAGFGRYGLVPAFRLDPRAEVAALCCTEADKARELANELEIPLAYGNAEQMIREAGLQVVACATPPAHQPAIAECALHHGLAVLVEKPVAVTVADAEKLWQLARQAHVANMVDFLFPEISVWQEAARLLADGEIGAVQTGVVNWLFQSYDHRHALQTWKTDTSQGGGVVSHFASHTLYYLEVLLGRIRQLSANLARPVNYSRPSETFLTLTLHFENAATVAVAVGSNVHFGSGHRIDLHGDQGSLVIASPSAATMNDFTLWRGRAGEAALKQVCVSEPLVQPTGTDTRVVPLARLIHRFLDSVESGIDSHPNFADGLRVQKLIAAIYHSHEQQRPIEV